MNKRQRIKNSRIKRDVRYICYDYICGMCKIRKIRPKAIWDYQQIKRKSFRKNNIAKVGDIRRVPVWKKRGYKLLKIQEWNGKWWIDS